MPVVCDFATVVGDDVVTIGTSAWEKTFSAAARVGSHNALLILSVYGLSVTVDVKMNNVKVGILTPCPTQAHWYVQQVYMTGAQIRDGDNELQLEANEADPQFKVKDVTLFFGQSA
jgi:hypothetical protein